MSGIYFKGGKVFGVPQESDIDTFLSQNFETALLSQFDQVGLVLEASSPISGTTSAKLTHDPTVPQYFKETRTVSEKFRGAGATVVITAKSGASLGNVTVLFRDETNNTPIQSSQQLSATSTVGVFQLGVKIPSNCTSFSYTITALPESGSPVTYIDDITIKSYWTGAANQGQTQHTYESPVVTDWVSYIPTFANFGSVTNTNFKWRRVGNVIEVKGTVDVGTPVAAIASMTLPNAYTVIQSATTGYYYNIGTYARSASTTGHGGVLLAIANSNILYFSGANAWSGTALQTMTPANATQIVAAGEYISIEFAVAVNELQPTETKTFVSTDLVPAKALSGSMSIDVPVVTNWQGYIPTFQGFGTPTNIEFEWRRVGEDVEIRGKFTAGTPTAVEARVGLPNGLTSANSSIIPSIQSVGTIAMYSTNGVAVRSALIEPNVNYMTFGNQAVGEPGLNKLLGNSFQGTGVTVSFTAKIPCAGLSATESKTWSSTQQLLSSVNDFELRAAGNAGESLVVDTTNIPFIPSSIKGDSASWDGSVLTILRSGIFNISGQIRYTASVSTPTVNLFINGVLSRRISVNQVSSSTSSFVWFSYTGHFDEGQTVSFRAGTAGTLINAPSDHFLQITQPGSIKVVETVADQKINIPTSELRMEGSTSRGGVATGIVRFNSITNIRGDAFVVVSNSDDGTYIQMVKSGKIDISVNLSVASGGTFAISKNQTTLTGFPTASEYLSSASVSSSAHLQNSGWSGSVVAGDIIRVYSTVNPSSNNSNQLNLFFQEQSIQVAVTNVLPQFSDSDSIITVSNAIANGSIYTKSTRFGTVNQNIGNSIRYVDSSTNGAEFHILESGMYEFTHIGAFNGTGYIGVSLNTTSAEGSNDIYSIPTDKILGIQYCETSTGIYTVSGSRNLEVGDIVRVQFGATPTSYFNNFHRMTIARRGKPNVTGVDVTPFISVPQSEKQYATYYYNGAWSNASDLTALTATEEARGSGLWRLTTTGLRILRDGYINLSLNAGTNSNTLVVAYMQKNGDYIALDLERTATATSIYTSSSWSGFVKANDLLTFDTTNASGVWPGGSRLTVSMEAGTIDSIVSEPETFSSDTVQFNYAPSTLYNISTLPNAPIGTLITYTYASGGNARTQTTTAPTQTVADMNTNGILIYSRAHNASSTANQPAVVAIQIGKGLKGKEISAFSGTGKSNALTYDHVMYTSVIEWGADVVYNENTGILVIDAGLNYSTGTTTRYVGYGVETVQLQTNAYFVINASKNPALVGVNGSSSSIGARAVQSSAQSIPASTLTTVVWDSLKSYDTNQALNATSGVFTVPENGYYKIESSVLYQSATWSVSPLTYADLYIYKNGSISSSSRTHGYGNTGFLNTKISDTLYLVEGDQITIRTFHNRSAATSLHTDSAWNYMAINKV